MSVNSQLLDGLVVFSEVINSGSFTAAAKNSNHSTSYISKEVSKLEERLGVRLLNRTTRSISLTPEGDVFFQQCQQIIGDAEAAEDLLAGHQLEPQGTLKISCPVSFGLSHLRPKFSAFIARYPKLTVELDLSDRKVDIVAEGYDVAIRASLELEDSSLISRRVMKSHGVTIASPAYLEKHGTPKRPEDLEHHHTISYRYLNQANVWNFTNSEGKQISVPVKSRFTTNSPEMELALCLAGQGITRLPRFNLKNELETGELVQLFSDLPTLEIGVYLVYPSRKHLASKVRYFIDFVLQELGDA